MPRLFPFTRCGVHDSAGHLNAYMAGLVGGKQTSKQSLLGQLPPLLCTDCGILTPMNDESCWGFIRRIAKVVLGRPDPMSWAALSSEAREKPVQLSNPSEIAYVCGTATVVTIAAFCSNLQANQRALYRTALMSVFDLLLPLLISTVRLTCDSSQPARCGWPRQGNSQPVTYKGRGQPDHCVNSCERKLRPCSDHPSLSSRNT
jgi:hypothetical protein